MIERSAAPRIVRSVLALVLLAGALAAGTLLRQDGQRGVPLALPGGTPVARGVVLPGACDALLDSYVERGVDLVGPYGWEAYAVALSEEMGDAAQALPRSSTATRDTAPTTQAATSSATGTNVQEAGVDEPDVVKTDGRTLWRVDGDLLRAYDVRGAAPTLLDELDLGRAPGVADLRDVELLVVDETLVAIGSTTERRSTGTAVMTVDVSDPAAPVVAHVLEVDAALLVARQHGDAVRLVASAALPDLDFVMPGRRVGEARATELNQRLVERTTLDDWLPTVSLDGGAPERLAECDEVEVPTEESGLGTVAVAGFDASAPLDSTDVLDVTALATAAETAYVSQEHAYLATGSWGVFEDCVECFEAARVVPGGDDAGRTRIHDLALDGTGAAYAGSGVVDGVVADRWAMDERDGLLRLAVGPSHRTGDFNSVVTMRASGGELEEVGRLDHLGPGEQITSVRWFDDLAIVVTFRQVDPLYTVDLGDPTAPTLLGKLKIPGFSDYLHPLGPHRMIGMGQGPTDGGWGAQAGLFATRDLTDPRRLSVVGYARDTEALAGADPRQFTWLPEQRIALTVVARGWTGRTGWVSVLRPRAGVLTHRMVEAAHGEDVDTLRTVPLPDGRVVLSTAGAASYLDLRG